MLRMESDAGWWLITHPDHAQLAGAFAAAWGNRQFRAPEPRDRVLHGISAHDDGWRARDAHPSVTRQGKPSAFSIELVGRYSAFEEIDLAEYLSVRDRAVRIVAEKDAYAGLLISMHTYNLLSEHADRSTIAEDGLALLDGFLERLREYQGQLMASIQADATLASPYKSAQMIREHFQLLQACDNLSLLSCVAFDKPAHLLHALPLHGGAAQEISVRPVGSRKFHLEPWPFAEPEVTFHFPARHVEGKTFASSAELEQLFMSAPVERLSVTLVS